MSLNPPIAHWTDRRVWLIGASTGIGRATAELLHSKGAKVIVSARSASALDALAVQCPGLQALTLDATDEAAVKAAAAQLLAAGALDLVMYCAGTYAAVRAQDMQSGDIAHHMQVNYLGAVYCIAAVLPAMLAAGKGHISVVSSVAGFRGLPKSLAYARRRHWRERGEPGLCANTPHRAKHFSYASHYITCTGCYEYRSKLGAWPV
jgi:NADP-dependent 3-hydroxy acid dehydrogenase YdfG